MSRKKPSKKVKYNGKLLYTTLSQYTIASLFDVCTDEQQVDILGKKEKVQQVSPILREVLIHLDRFASETIPSLVELFGEKTVHEFLALMEDRDLLHVIEVETVENLNKPMLVISENIVGDTYKIIHILGKPYCVAVAMSPRTGVLVWKDYYKERSIDKQYEAIKPQLNAVQAIREANYHLTTKVDELMQELKKKVWLEKKVALLEEQQATMSKIKSIYGSFNVEDMLVKMNLVLSAIFSNAEEELGIEGKDLANSMAHQASLVKEVKSGAEKVEIPKDDKLQALVEKAKQEQEELENVEVPVEEGDDLDDLDDFDEEVVETEEEVVETEEEIEEEIEEESSDIPEELQGMYDMLKEASKNELLLFAYKEHIKVDTKLPKEELLDNIFKAIVDAHDTEEEQEDFVEDEDKELLETVETTDDDAFNEEEELLDSNSSFPEDKEMEEELTTTTTVSPNASGKENVMIDKYNGEEFKEQVTTFIELMATTNRDIIYPNNAKIVDKSCRAIARIVYKNEVDISELFEALTWAIQDDFWRNQVITLSGLKKVSKSNGLAKWQNIMNAYRAYQRKTKKEITAESVQNDIRTVSI